MTSLTSTLTTEDLVDDIEVDDDIDVDDPSKRSLAMSSRYRRRPAAALPLPLRGHRRGRRGGRDEPRTKTRASLDVILKEPRRRGEPEDDDVVDTDDRPRSPSECSQAADEFVAGLLLVKHRAS